MKSRGLLFFTFMMLTSLATHELHAQWISSEISKGRYALAATSLGSKAFFAGGDNEKRVFKIVDIYDNNTQTWSTDSLSEARLDLTATSLGTKVFFAGGMTISDFSSVVDIYDINSKSWTYARLTEPRCDLSSTSLGTKVFFAGGRKSGDGDRSNIVDIYDINSKKWSVSHLSEPRCKLVATSLGTKVFFAGGLRGRRESVSNVVDIYDVETNTWTIHQLSRERFDLAATAVGNKVFFAGGVTNQGDTDIVDIYDISTDTWSTHRLSQARGDLSATTVGNKVFFVGGYLFSAGLSSNVVDIYDNSINTWTTSFLSEARNSLGAASVGTKAIFAGGWGNVLNGPLKIVDIYETGNTKDTDPPNIFLTYKNNGVVNGDGSIEVEIHVTDASRIDYVLLNNVKRIENGVKDSVILTGEFLPGEEILVQAGDSFHQKTEKNFFIKSASEGSKYFANVKTTRRYFALLLAVQEYKDPKIEPLNEPVKDAILLKDILTKKYTFNEEDITLLKNPSLDDIGLAFESLTNKITSEDMLLVFYAGHGFFDEKTNIGYWLPADATENNKSKWFRNSALVENIRAINSKHTLLIADACFSGGIFKTRAPFNNASLDIVNMLKRTSRKAITSGSMTTVPDKSIFMKYLLKTLEENQNTYLPTEDLYDEVRQSMKNNSVVKPAYGEIQNTGDTGGNFVFIQRENKTVK